MPSSRNGYPVFDADEWHPWFDGESTVRHGNAFDGVRALKGKDVDFERREILIRDGKGAKDRVAMLPESLTGLLQAHLQQRRALFDNDTWLSKVSVYLPDALARIYLNAATEWAWQYIFLLAVFQSIRAAR